MRYLLSPHDDDAALFAAVTCLREQPTIVVVADSYVQPARGEVGCSAADRAAETAKANEVLGCRTERLGLRDDDLSLSQVQDALRTLVDPEGVIYVPALEGGHAHHDYVAQAAAQVFGPSRLRCYSTYARLSQYGAADLQPVGTTEIIPTGEESARKMAALRCYDSQIRVNLPHFQAVMDRSEWLSGYRRVQLGCGEQLKAGWFNVDTCAPRTRDASDFYRLDCSVERLADLVGAHSVDYVFSEDFLEHVAPERRVHVINQCWEILKPGGIMEHYVPNAGSQNDYGSPSHLSHWNLQTFEHFDVASHRWVKDRAFEGIEGGFTKVSADLLNWRVEADVVNRAQSIRVRYRAVEVAAC
jgi:predicted SAM-dependent methyltransferase